MNAIKVTPILTWADYVPQALHTASMGKSRELEGFVRVSGLCGEAGELAEALQVWDAAGRPDCGHLLDHVVKELGDFLWYAAALGAWGGCVPDMGLHALQGSVCSLTYQWGDVMVHAAKLAELMKKHLGHDRAFDPDKFKQLLARCLVEAAVIAEHTGLVLSTVCAVNVAKLRARFQGGGFSAGLSGQKLDEQPTGA